MRDPGVVPKNVETSRTTEIDSLRNRWASRVANFALRFATEDYRSFVGGSILYGMDAAARDVAEGNEPPPSWTEQ